MNQRDPALGLVKSAGSQSLHSSRETRNERGAKGGRKVMRALQAQIRATASMPQRENLNDAVINPHGVVEIVVNVTQ